VKKSLFIFAVLVVACSFASATNYSFGFESTGHGLYCDFPQVNNGFSAASWGGDQNLEAGCGLSRNAAAAGFTSKLSAAQNPQGFAIKGITLGTAEYQAEGFGSYYEWTIAFNVKCSEKKFGWVGIADYVSGLGTGAGFIFGDNYGFISCNIPGKARAHNGQSTNGHKVQ
jgi:hypothetical protein